MAKLLQLPVYSRNVSPFSHFHRLPSSKLPYLPPFQSLILDEEVANNVPRIHSLSSKQLQYSPQILLGDYFADASIEMVKN